jgi:hypothetical protein
MVFTIERCFAVFVLGTLFFSSQVVDLEDELKTIGENMKILEVEEEKALAREEKFQARREMFCRARISKPVNELRNRVPAWRSGTTTLFDIPAHQSPDF